MSEILKQESQELLPSHINIETFKSVYYWINAKPDTHIKVYEDEKIVSFNDIILLNEKVQKKLENHDIFTNITSINLSFDNGETQSFNAWAAFKEYPWQISEKTESVTIIWDISVKLPNYQLAQKHTLKVRIGSSLRPNELFHIITNSDDPLEINENSSFIVCKIDFINIVLSKELISIVTEWYNVLKPLEEKSSTLKFITKHRQNFARTAHYFTTFIGLCFLYLAFKLHFRFIEFEKLTLKEVYQDLFFWFLLIFSVYFIFNLLGSIFGQKVYEKINSYRDNHTFSITKGDENEQIKINEKNRKVSKNLIVDLLVRVGIAIGTFFANQYIGK